MTRVLIVDVLAGGAGGGWYTRRVKHPNFAGVPVACVAVWCASLGAAVELRSFTGSETLRELTRGTWDVAFVAAATRDASIALALGAALRASGAVTAIGGPHAHAYPERLVESFDYVLGQTGRAQVQEVLDERRRASPGRWVSAEHPPAELPGLRERAPFVRAAHHKARLVKVVPLLASVGCPYRCAFCTDADVAYRPFDPSVVADEVRALVELFPGCLGFWHDPNFGVRFDELLDAIGRGAGAARPKFGAESSLSLLSGDRIDRLARAGFVAMLPGVESFGAPDPKQGARGHGSERLASTVAQVEALVARIPYVQVNLIVGLEQDRGTDAAALARAFVERAAGCWPNVNLLTAYGRHAPLARALSDAGRVLPVPWTLLDQKTCSNVASDDPAAPFREALALAELAGSPAVMARRLRATSGVRQRLIHLLRAYGREQRARVAWYRRALELLDTDRGFRAFFSGEPAPVPAALRELAVARLGSWASAVPELGPG
ncbi:MAG: radical SAM protein [Myxococcota bacterium]